MTPPHAASPAPDSDPDRTATDPELTEGGLAGQSLLLPAVEITDPPALLAAILADLATSDDPKA
ncbi:MAG: hypothetical protein WAT25_21520, partial [Paracoccaceae bacterium]